MGPERRFRLDGRTAIVAGAGGGIGGGIAEAFAAAGAKVGCLDRDDGAVRATAARIGASGGLALAIPCDVTKEAEIAAAVTAVSGAFGPIRVLVNSTSADDPSGDVTEIDPATWNAVIAVNLTSAYLTSRAVIPGMARAGGGSIIHVASQLGRVASPRRAVYCASKGALIQLAKAMALDHAGQGIRVNTLSPGAIETRRMLLRYGDMENARKVNTPRYPVGRLGQPAEMGEAALFLASDASSFMTGSDLLVDGGYSAT